MPCRADPFGTLPDPRGARCKLSPLLEILTIALGWLLCGAAGWEAMQEGGLSKPAGLHAHRGSDFNGIPTDEPCAG